MAERIKFAPERQKHPESAQYHLTIAPTLRNSSCSVRGPGFGKVAPFCGLQLVVEMHDIRAIECRAVGHRWVWADDGIEGGS
jgi:hypothetical protein